jgi:glycyl-tRNA synthetase beta subunit
MVDFLLELNSEEIPARFLVEEIKLREPFAAMLAIARAVRPLAVAISRVG